MSRRRRADRSTPSEAQAAEAVAPTQGPDTPAPTPAADTPAAAGSQTPPDAGAVVADLSTIDADASDLVLRRAIQLADESEFVADQMPVDALQQAAAELHVPVAAVADALAEYRAGAIGGVRSDRSSTPTITDRVAKATTRKRTAIDRLIGPPTVKIRHRTGLTDAEVSQRLADWLGRHHKLRVVVNQDGTVVGMRRRGMVPAVARSARQAVGREGLSGVREVRGAVVAGQPGQTSICVVADVTSQRTQSVLAGSAVTMGGAAVVSAAALITAAPITLIGFPVVMGAGWVTSRVTHRIRVRRIEEEMELTTEQVAVGAKPNTLVQGITDRLGSVRSPRR